MKAVTFLLVFLVSLTIGRKPYYCKPSKNCWPSTTEVDEFNSSVQGSLITEDNNQAQYNELTTGFNRRTVQYPAWVLIAQNATDIQNGVAFAKTHNVQISVYSTGHSLSGRNTGNHSLMIHLSQMKGYSFNDDTNPTSITVETGLKWSEIYPLVDAYGHKVCLSGCTSCPPPHHNLS